MTRVIGILSAGYSNDVFGGEVLNGLDDLSSLFCDDRVEDFAVDGMFEEDAAVTLPFIEEADDGLGG